MGSFIGKPRKRLDQKYISKTLPPDAVKMLLEASEVEPIKDRAVSVDKAISTIKRMYPKYFLSADDAFDRYAKFSKEVDARIKDGYYERFYAELKKQQQLQKSNG